MKLVTNPHEEAGNPYKEAGEGLLKRLRERNFTGYVRPCIEELLAGADAGKYTFTDLGTTEIEVLDLAINHVGAELIRGHQYPFAYLKLKNDLVCRKSRVEGAHIMPLYATRKTPLAEPANDLKAA